MLNNIGGVLLIILCSNTIHGQQIAETNTFKIEEAGVLFDAPGGWTLASKTGDPGQGMVQYVYTHDHVKGEGQLVNPTIIVTLDKGSWFNDESHYLKEKLGYHQELDDSILRTVSPENMESPLMISAYYSEGISGLENNPYGQHLRMVTFWNEKVGFHMVIQTSLKDLQANEEHYKALLKSIRYQ